jgi:quinol monooxygenase YgiN
MRCYFPMTLAAALALTGPLAGQDRHPIVAKVQAEVKDATKPFTLAIVLKVKSRAADRFEAAFAKAQKETRKEKGCLAYDLNREAKEAGRYFIYERWKSLADLEAHLASAHIKTLFGEVGELLDGDPDVKVMVPAGE